ncbi:hypothetical protein ZIOFF_031666 [Zingiber officinale]|uniref:Rho-GAP domain-containing protein n=1 Tax=Zingiber officinale TaxID=94328 RepID=A0A8J5GMB4_ZINOF|nr:hypothetical protein ZIOFF_031666 [Zingiber officinale]
MLSHSSLAVGLQKKILECPPESQNITNIADDAISIVFGKEAWGRVRGMGFGVTPSKVGASVQQNGMVQQLQTIVQNVQQQMQEMRQQNQLEMQEMRSMFLQSMRQQNHPEQIASGGICSGIGNEFGNNSDINIGAKKNSDFGHVFQAWFREIPTGLLDSLSSEQVMKCQTEEDCGRLARSLTETEAAAAMLDWTINLMANVVREEQANKMNARNIATVFAPNMSQVIN